MPWVEPRPDARLRVARLQANGESFGVDERVFSGARRVVVVVLEAVVVGEIVALGDDAVGVEFLELYSDVRTDKGGCAEEQ